MLLKVPANVNLTSMDETLLSYIKTETFDMEVSTSDQTTSANFTQDPISTVQRTPNRIRTVQCCPHCSFKGPIGDKNMHIMTVHDQLRPFVCAFCGFTSAKSYNMSIHVKTLHIICLDQNPKATNRQECPYCPFVKDAIRVKRHIFQAHDKMFQCPTCAYTCGSVKRIKEHRLSIHENVRMYKCKSCEYSTYCLSKLNKHVKCIHENVKYQCEYCPFNTGYPQTLKKHVQCTHESSKYQCEYCPFSTRYPHNFKRHNIRHHQNVKPSNL